MTGIGSWRFWVILALALTTLACAGRAERRERREEARQERLERREAARAERSQRNDRSRTETAQTSQPAAAQSLTPVSTAPAAIAGPDVKIVFVRPSYFVGDPIPASVFDVTDSGPAKFVGTLTRKTRVEYSVKPGLHTFMIVSEAADFMQAQIVSGKTYYALITPRPGAWKARFSLVPVRQNEQRVQKWEEEIPLVTPNSRSLAWAKQNASSVEKKRDRYWPEWKTKPEEQRLSQTLNEEDGR